MRLENVFKDGREVAQTPTEGKLFKVNPLGIDRSKFKKPRSDERQEWTRQTILNALYRVDKCPEKYASAFYTMIPEKKWNGNKTGPELEAYANDLGGQIADWVEQSLEWAQRITNGESWETICNNPDTAKWFRVIRCDDVYYRLVGGSCDSGFFQQPSYVLYFGFNANHSYFIDTVPLVVLR